MISCSYCSLLKLQKSDSRMDVLLHDMLCSNNFLASEVDIQAFTIFQIEGTHKGGWVPGFLRFSGGQTSSPPTTPTRRSTIGTPVSRPGDTVSTSQV